MMKVNCHRKLNESCQKNLMFFFADHHHHLMTKWEEPKVDCWEQKQAFGIVWDASKGPLRYKRGEKPTRYLHVYSILNLKQSWTCVSSWKTYSKIHPSDLFISLNTIADHLKGKSFSDNVCRFSDNKLFIGRPVRIS